MLSVSRVVFEAAPLNVLFPRNKIEIWRAIG
jgi:hypothetical protein